MAKTGTRSKYSQPCMENCMRMYLRGFTISEIERETGVPERTLYNWRDNGDWDSFNPPDTIEIAISRRINLLAERENKTDDELKEFERLCATFGKTRIDLARAKKLEAEALAIGTGKLKFVPPEDDAPRERGPYKKDKNQRRREKSSKNDISGITPEMLDAVREKIFYHYQKLWYAQKNDPESRRNRFILKSRQIGATYYFAFEAFDDAVRTGDNQIFLSASRDQAEVFKAYIIAFAQEHFDVELKGQGCITLSNGAELRFLSTNSNTAQSYHGHLYKDEVFWIPNYRKLNKVASGMAAHKKWRRTDFSTPSAISHEAYAVWSGELYNKKLKVDDRRDFDISHEALKDGWLGPDKVWRHMVTVEDAEAQGCDLFDIDELRLEYSEDDFNNLFMCKFIDDSQSVFSLAKLLQCCANDESWKDYDENAAMPYGRRPVAVGYDPSRVRDNASEAILAVPIAPREPWRVLKTKNHNGQNFQYQANRLKDTKNSHNVVHIGIDTTGIGHGVFELVVDWFPLATPIHYSMDMKTQLVMKALDVIENGRLRWLAKDFEITRAFLMITKTTTGSGLITYASSRSSEAGHADIAWSIMHALIYEPINNNRRKTTVTFSEAA
jgi:uncharacterized protein YjcR